MRFASIILLLFIFSSCDRVEFPHEIQEETCLSTTGQVIPRNVIVEDFTGFRCVNCPSASNTLEQLQGIYGDQLIPVGVHVVDFFSEPQANPTYPGLFVTDYRTPDGAEYENAFGILGIPVGTVNRTKENGSLLSSYGAWDGKVGELVVIPADVAIKIKKAEYTSSSNSIQIEVDAILANSLNGNYNMTIYLVEDSILDGQFDTSEVIEDYVHRHVLRGTLNGTWGNPIFSDRCAGDSIRFAGNYSLPSSINSAPNPNPDIDISKCEIVAYIYKTGFEEYEIIQAQRKDVDF